LCSYAQLIQTIVVQLQASMNDRILSPNGNRRLLRQAKKSRMVLSNPLMGGDGQTLSKETLAETLASPRQHENAISTRRRRRESFLLLQRLAQEKEQAKNQHINPFDTGPDLLERQRRKKALLRKKLCCALCEHPFPRDAMASSVTQGEVTRFREAAALRKNNTNEKSIGRLGLIQRLRFSMNYEVPKEGERSEGVKVGAVDGVVGVGTGGMENHEENMENMENVEIVENVENVENGENVENVETVGVKSVENLALGEPMPPSTDTLSVPMPNKTSVSSSAMFTSPTRQIKKGDKGYFQVEQVRKPLCVLCHDLLGRQYDIDQTWQPKDPMPSESWLKLHGIRQHKVKMKKKRSPRRLPKMKKQYQSPPPRQIRQKRVATPSSTLREIEREVGIYSDNDEEEADEEVEAGAEEEEEEDSEEEEEDSVEEEEKKEKRISTKQMKLDLEVLLAEQSLLHEELERTRIAR
jgi:hypothetical protein